MTAGNHGRGERARAPRRIVSLLLTLLCVSTMTVTTYASETYYLLQTAVNQTTWTIEGAVIADEVGATGNVLESRRYSDSQLKNISENSDSIQGGTLLTGFGETGRDISSGTTLLGKENLALTFPGQMAAMNWGKGGGFDADKARAEAIRDALVFDLNEAISLAYPDRSGWTMSDFESNMTTLLTAVRDKGTAGAATFSSVSSTDTISMFDDTVLSSDYVKATDGKRTFYLLWRIPKGYVDVGFGTGAGVRHKPAGLKTVGSDKDASYINWEMLAYEAIGNSLLNGDANVNVGNVTASTPSALEKVIVGFFGSLCDGIRGILGLWSIDQLVFNAGNRGTSAYIFGLFPASWENTIWAFFVLAETLSLVFLLYSVIMNVLRRAAATTNIMSRMKAWEQLKDIAVVAVLLSILPLLLQILMSLSYQLTGIIKGAAGGKTVADLRLGMAASAGSIGGIIVQFMYLGIDIYYNFFYLLRSLTTAVLIIVSPICIVATTFDSKYKALTGGWTKELMANILIQPIHALVFSIILLFPASSHRFDSIIMAYATIPLTSALRSLFFGSAGSMGDRAALAGKNKVTSAAKGVAAGAIGAAVGGFTASKGGGGKDTGAPIGGAPDGAGTTPEAEAGAAAVAAGAADGMAEAAAHTREEPAAPAANAGSGDGSVSAVAQNAAAFSARHPFQSLDAIAKENLPEPSYQMLSAAKTAVKAGTKAAAGIALSSVVGGIGGATGMNLGQSLGNGGRNIAAAGFAGLRAAAGQVSDVSAARKKAPEESADNMTAMAAGDAPVSYDPDVVAPAGDDTPTPWFGYTEAQELFAGDRTEFEEESEPLYQGEMTSVGTTSEASMDEEALQDAGISRVYGDRSHVRFTVSGKNAKEYAAYSEMLNRMPELQRTDMVKSTGFDVSPVMRKGEPTGAYRVSINKENYKNATGATVVTSRDGPGLSVTAKNGNKPSLIPHVQANRTYRPEGMGTQAVRQEAPVAPTTAVRMMNGVESSQSNLAVYSLGGTSRYVIHASEAYARESIAAPTAEAVRQTVPVLRSEEIPTTDREPSMEQDAELADLSDQLDEIDMRDAMAELEELNAAAKESSGEE